MSYFEDQEDAWFANNCQGDISDVDPYDPDWKPKRTPIVSVTPQLTKSQKRNRQRKAAKLRKANAREVA
jgi:hypothetical protein